MDSDLQKATIPRHKCPACYKQYKMKEHLIEHMKVAFHSVHDPQCAVCRKHCKSFESLREHLTGPLAKANCRKIFSERGCDICMKLFDSSTSLSQHREMCLLSAPSPIGAVINSCEQSQSYMNLTENNFDNRLEAIAIDCEMVGGGSDGSVDLCARVCLTDEDENVLFHTYVWPHMSILNYRYEITGLSEEHIRNAMPLKEVRDKILQILYNGDSIGRSKLDGRNAKLLVGHDLDCMGMYYPEHLLRDTAKYHPLMITNLASHTLKYLTRKFLGYGLQSGMHDPYEDSVATMRLYKRFRAVEHQKEGIDASVAAKYANDIQGSFDSWTTDKLEKMTPDELYELSGLNYKCWYLDNGQALQVLVNRFRDSSR